MVICGIERVETNMTLDTMAKLAPAVGLEVPAMLMGSSVGARPWRLGASSVIHLAMRAQYTPIACDGAAAVQRGLWAADPLAEASVRQRSNVARLIPTSRDTKPIAELSGGNSLALIRSL
jgi:hypothetical protein